MKHIKDFIIESSIKYVDNITKKGNNKITIEDALDGVYNTVEVNVKYFTKPNKDRQVIIVDLGEGKYIDFFKNGKFTWEPLTYFEDDEDPKVTWEDNNFGKCPDWFTKDTLPKNWDEVDQVLKFE